ncbi:uncharacterized protein BJ171DRAFT_608798 [Polychytrium aggregatum]|uniref:uncharacterized protein n=1 Tax=Polychytrium aggregatum TaxID=110093 RepID=UPI0022FF2722|nr:uncharacterized protein BJ171DRAFT_608798 [Polychytrium aggregatum]KAI9209605.1 hypothetical protein BJ171DRAFT_608798 [Polychytrium aggregatum]
MRTPKASPNTHKWSRSAESLGDKSLERRIAEVLVANECNLLAAICNGAFVGDTAAKVSVGVISLLKMHSETSTTEFLKRLLKAKIESYLKRQKDLSDILRDNSMTSMLLNTFARSEGSHYLSKCLLMPICEIHKFSDRCEIDPSKIKPPLSAPKDGSEAGGGTSEAAVEHTIGSNMQNLKKAVVMILRSIKEHHEDFPAEMQRLCYFLCSKITEIETYIGDAARGINSQAALQALPSASKTDGDGGGNLEVVTENSRASRSSVKSAKQKTKRLSIFKRSHSRSDNKVDTGQVGDSKLAEVEDGAMKASPASSVDFSTAKSVESEFSFTEDGRRNHQSQDSLASINIHDVARQMLSPSITTTPPPLQSRSRPNSLLLSSGASSVRESTATSYQHTLSMAERLVGTFLFLRFFIPAITTPDTYGLIHDKLSAASRRGFILCGKIMTALCNDVEFGSKEVCLAPLNSFLNDHRTDIKELIQVASGIPGAEKDRIVGIEESSSESHTPKSASGADACMTPVRLSDIMYAKPVPLKSQTSRSLPTLLQGSSCSSDIKSAGAPTRSRTESSEYAEANALFVYIGHSLSKIEKELELYLQQLPVHQSEGISNNFIELKKLIESSSYWDRSTQPTDKSAAKLSLLSKFGKFRLKSLF